MTRPRAADEFAAIRARMEELQRERERARHREPENDLGARVRSIPIEEIADATQRQLGINRQKRGL